MAQVGGCLILRIGENLQILSVGESEIRGGRKGMGLGSILRTILLAIPLDDSKPEGKVAHDEACHGVCGDGFSIVRSWSRDVSFGALALRCWS